ncbi:MAG: chloride channel protein [Sulfurimonas sp.]|nr:chloride channel protein [Sulfurimonas sp.]
MIKKHVTEQTTIFLSVTKWVFLSSIIGVIIGAVVSFFLKSIEWAEHHQGDVPFPYYFLLPFMLVLTVWIVKIFAPNAEGHGTEKVIEAVHKRDGKIDIAVIPVKLLATLMTIFAGGSVGKEGPGAQIGAGTASFIATTFKFRKEDRKKLVICGISAGFASVFGTPIAGAIFGVEVLIIGVIMYDVLLPSFIAGFAAFTTTQFLGVEYTYYDVRFYQQIALDLPLIAQVVIAGVFFGVVSDILVTTLTKTSKLVKKLKYSAYRKAFAGGLILVILTLILGERYLGLGMDTIKDALNPMGTINSEVPWYAFLAKTIFTSITLGVGGSGGIITPVFFVGATSGNFFGHLIGSDHVALFAALGFVSVASGAANAPIAATIMAVELFGIEIAHYAAISAVISFLLTGHRSVFNSQKLGMKKSGALDIEIGEDIDSTKVSLDGKDAKKLQSFQDRFSRKKERFYMKKRPKL